MNTNQIKDIALKLHDARLSASSLKQFSANIEDFKRDDAYSIQEAGIAMREQAGEKVIGLKMGLTSKEKRDQMNLDAPLYGVLTDKMQVENTGTYILKGSIHPKIEPEIAFHIKSELKGEVTREEVLAATDSVCAALEILDSRYEGFKYFSMEDVISDNSSSSHYILGPSTNDFKQLKLEDLQMDMLINGEVVKSGNSKAISDDPVISIIQLAQLLAKRGQSIPAGCFVLSGAATTAVNLEARMNVELKVAGLPAMNVEIE
jgi:2-oxo-3-hexenedioate decarboxylase